MVGHYVNGCPESNDHKMNEHGAPFMEYNMNSVEIWSQLVTEIEKNMVITHQYETCPVGL